MLRAARTRATLGEEEPRRRPASFCSPRCPSSPAAARQFEASLFTAGFIGGAVLATTGNLAVLPSEARDGRRAIIMLRCGQPMRAGARDAIGFTPRGQTMLALSEDMVGSDGPSGREDITLEVDGERISLAPFRRVGEREATPDTEVLFVQEIPLDHPLLAALRRGRELRVSAGGGAADARQPGGCGAPARPAARGVRAGAAAAVSGHRRSNCEPIAVNTCERFSFAIASRHRHRTGHTRMLRRSLLLFAPALALTLPAPPADAQERVLNLYSSRHYDSDRDLYEAFTRATGIRVRLIEGDTDQVIERIRTEGANSPADVLLTVDAARLHRAQAAGLLQPVRSAVLEARIPAHLRDPEGHWFGVSKRARVIMFDRQNPPQNLTRMEDLADPRFRGQVCVRSSSHPYNLSLMGSILLTSGEAAAEAWARGLVANFARQPQGGDTPQFQAIPPGQCRLAIANTYYLARFGASQVPAERALFERIGVIFPNQADRGTHVNVSGAGVARHAPNREAAIAFIEFLTSEQAQRIFADRNFEYPVVAGMAPHPALAALGEFREDTLNAAQYGAASAQALQIMQRAGWR